MKHIKQETKQILKSYRNPFAKSLLTIVFLNALVSAFTGNNAIASFIGGVLLFMLISAFQITMANTIRNQSPISFNDTLSTLKKYMLDLFLLALMVQMVSFILSSMVIIFLVPLVEEAMGEITLAIELGITLVSFAMSYMVMYMFLFAPYYIEDKQDNAFDAFRDSFKDTKGLKFKMFRLELPYLLFVVALFIAVLVSALVLSSDVIAIFGLLIASILSMYISVDLFTVRTVYYLEYTKGKQHVS